MIILLFTLILLIFLIVLTQMNPGVITVNLLGLVIKNIPMSFLMLLFIGLGIIWGSSLFGIKYLKIKKQNKDLMKRFLDSSVDK